MKDLELMADEWEELQEVLNDPEVQEYPTVSEMNEELLKDEDYNYWLATLADEPPDMTEQDWENFYQENDPEAWLAWQEEMAYEEA